MKRIHNVISLAIIFVREALREPGWMFWSLAFPSILVVTLFLNGNGALDDRLYGVLLGFIAIVTGLRGTGTYMLGRREAGFLKAFVAFRAAQRRFLVAQIISGFIFTYGVVLIFSLILYVTPGSLGLFDFLGMAIRSIPVVLCVGLSSCMLNLVPMKFQRVFGVMSMSFAPMLLLAMARVNFGDEVAWVVWINYFNPVTIGAEIIDPTERVEWPTLLICVILSVLSVFLTLSKFSTETYWDKEGGCRRC